MMDFQKEGDAYLKMLVGNDAISNDQAETLKLMPEGSHFYTYGNQVSAAKLDLINWGWNSWVKAKSQAVPKWISVDEQEPECGETVLICWSDALDVDPEMDFMDIDVETGAYYWSNCEADKPTHWMPLPKMIEAQEQSHE